jgi:hypothetical protein
MSQQALPETDRVRADPGPWRVWFALLGSAAAWAVHFLVFYGLVEFGCGGLQGGAVMGLSFISALLLLAGLLGLAVVAGSALAARLVWREGRAADDDARAERDRYIGLASLVLSGIFALAILAETIPAALLSPCT